MACLRMIPQNIVARKRSVFLEHHPFATDKQEQRECNPANATLPDTPSSKINTTAKDGVAKSPEENAAFERVVLPSESNSVYNASSESRSNGLCANTTSVNDDLSSQKMLTGREEWKEEAGRSASTASTNTSAEPTAQVHGSGSKVSHKRC